MPSESIDTPPWVTPPTPPRSHGMSLFDVPITNVPRALTTGVDHSQLDSGPLGRRPPVLGPLIDRVPSVSTTSVDQPAPSLPLSRRTPTINTPTDRVRPAVTTRVNKAVPPLRCKVSTVEAPIERDPPEIPTTVLQPVPLPLNHKSQIVNAQVDRARVADTMSDQPAPPPSHRALRVDAHIDSVPPVAKSTAKEPPVTVSLTKETIEAPKDKVSHKTAIVQQPDPVPRSNRTPILYSHIAKTPPGSNARVYTPHHRGSLILQEPIVREQPVAATRTRQPAPVISNLSPMLNASIDRVPSDTNTKVDKPLSHLTRNAPMPDPLVDRVPPVADARVDQPVLPSNYRSPTLAVRVPSASKSKSRVNEPGPLSSHRSHSLGPRADRSPPAANTKVDQQDPPPHRRSPPVEPLVDSVPPMAKSIVKQPVPPPVTLTKESVEAPSDRVSNKSIMVHQPAPVPRSDRTPILDSHVEKVPPVSNARVDSPPRRRSPMLQEPIVREPHVAATRTSQPAPILSNLSPNASIDRAPSGTNTTVDKPFLHLTRNAPMSDPLVDRVPPRADTRIDQPVPPSSYRLPTLTDRVPSASKSRVNEPDRPPSNRSRTLDLRTDRGPSAANTKANRQDSPPDHKSPVVDPLALVDSVPPVPKSTVEQPVRPPFTVMKETIKAPREKVSHKTVVHQPGPVPLNDGTPILDSQIEKDPPLSDAWADELLSPLRQMIGANIDKVEVPPAATRDDQVVPLLSPALPALRPPIDDVPLVATTHVDQPHPPHSSRTPTPDVTIDRVPPADDRPVPALPSHSLPILDAQVDVDKTPPVTNTGVDKTVSPHHRRAPMHVASVDRAPSGANTMVDKPLPHLTRDAPMLHPLVDKVTPVANVRVDRPVPPSGFGSPTLIDRVPPVSKSRVDQRAPPTSRRSRTFDPRIDTGPPVSNTKVDQQDPPPDRRLPPVDPPVDRVPPAESRVRPLVPPPSRRSQTFDSRIDRDSPETTTRGHRPIPTPGVGYSMFKAPTGTAYNTLVVDQPIPTLSLSGGPIPSPSIDQVPSVANDRLDHPYRNVASIEEIGDQIKPQRRTTLSVTDPGLVHPHRNPAPIEAIRGQIQPPTTVNKDRSKMVAALAKRIPYISPVAGHLQGFTIQDDVKQHKEKWDAVKVNVSKLDVLVNNVRTTYLDDNLEEDDLPRSLRATFQSLETELGRVKRAYKQSNEMGAIKKIFWGKSLGRKVKACDDRILNLLQASQAALAFNPRLAQCANGIEVDSVNVNALYDEDQTPLHVASQLGQLNAIRSLVDCGADLNAENKDEETPLFLVSRNGNVEATELLLRRKANLRHRNLERRTPLHVAAENGHQSIVQLLLKSGADPNAKNVYDWTPLHLTSWTGRSSVVDTLLKRDVDVNVLNKSDWTPLHMASKKGHTDVVELLLSRGANVYSREESGETALHLAAYYGHIQVVRLLINHRADLGIKNNKNETPLDLARMEGHQDIIRILEAEIG